mmetsp:Transcript_30586/g.65958  ORF Transcript_30586/g.65958 Transcript_30586/m.65958 type:complete len:376 (+) Transcript_30586:235-1362(+)|eukprot:CAMPEP_0206469168 /NCGR_PEP_ID=MMETSP0324_2-20121206/30101_1 /ASSEMBLY_ACC=CAM_ASM_000836 /TAXON_ID=2866 /ORGANISM="Crypthecodinium cohnii, Strain Seligo" /LENGTH=375 /DNA_ID=CAMNT_0053942839 /DNA_START=168 /DNA_END=1295 /DNA_ORIENTATION=+
MAFSSVASVKCALVLVLFVVVAFPTEGVRVKEQSALDFVADLDDPSVGGIASPSPNPGVGSPTPSVGTGVGTNMGTEAGSNSSAKWANLANMMMNGGMALGTGLLNGYAQGNVEAQNGMNQQPQSWGNAMANGAMNAGHGVFQGMAAGQGMPAPCNTTGNPYSQIFGGLMRGFGQFGSNVMQQLQNGANSAVPMWQRLRNASANSWQQQTNHMKNWWNQANVPQQAGMYAGQFANQMTGAVGQQLANNMDINSLAAQLGIPANALNGLVQNPSTQGAMQLAQNQASQMVSANLPALAQQLGMTSDQLTSLLSNNNLQALLNQMPAGDAKNTLQALAASLGKGTGTGNTNTGAAGLGGGAPDPMLAALAAAQNPQR